MDNLSYIQDKINRTKEISGQYVFLHIDEMDFVFSELDRLMKENDRLIGALETIKTNSEGFGFNYKLDRVYATAYHTLRELKEGRNNE